MLHGFNCSELVLLSTLILRILMSVILSFFNTRDLYSGCAEHTQSNW